MVAVQNIAEGVQTAGSVAEQAGLSFEQFASIVAKVSETTRMEGSQVGNMMKTIMARTSRVKDPDTSAEDRSNASKALASIGIEVWDEQTGEYQNFGKTLDQLSEKWDTLSDSTRSYVAEAMAGVRGQNVFMNMVSSWNDAKDLVTQVEEDPNYYLEVQEKGMDFLQSKMDSLKASMQNFWYNLLDAGAIGEGITLITNLTNALGDLLSTVKLLPVIGDTLGLGTLGSIGVFISQLVDNILIERGKIKKESGSAGLFGGFKSGLKNTFKDLNTLGLKSGSLLKDGETSATITSLFAEGKQMGGVASGIKNIWSNMTGLSKSVVKLAGSFAVLEIATKTFDALTDSSQETKEKINELGIAQSKNAEKFKSAQSIVKSHGAEWERLSEGVNADGTNNSLSTEEYARFQELSNQIAGVFPSLIQGFDSTGNAILKAGTNLKDFNQQLSMLEIRNARENSLNFDEYFKGFKDLTNRDGLTQIADGGFTDALGAILRIDPAEVGKFLEQGDVSKALGELSLLNQEDLIKELGSSKYNDYMDSYFKSKGITSENISNNFNEVRATILSEYNKLNSEIEAAAMPVRRNLQDYLTVLAHDSNTGELNDGISKELLSDLNSFIGNISVDQLTQLDELGIDIQDYVSNILSTVSNNPELEESLNNVMSIDEDSSMKDIIASMDDVKTLADGLKDTSEDDVLSMMNINAKEVHDKYQDILKDIKDQEKGEKKVKKTLKDNNELLDDFIESNEINTAEELEKLRGLINKSDTWGDVLKNWTLKSLDFDNIDAELENLEANLASVKEGFQNLNEAISQSNSASGMNTESIEKVKSLFSELDGYDADKLFESTYSGVHLNSQELAKLTKEYKDTNYSKYTGELSDLEKEYAALCAQIDNASDAVQRNQALQNRDKIKEKIKEAELLQSQYEGLTNAVNMWQQAQSRGDEGDLYESVRSGFDEAKKMFDEGWIGDDRFQSFTQMFSAEDLSGAGSDVYEQVFANSLPKMQRWFAEGRQGVNNFIQDIGALNEGLIDTQGNVDFSKMPSMDTLAEQLGVNKSLIDTMFKALNRAGADLDFSEGADRLRGLREEVNSVGKGLDDATKEKYTVDLDVENAEDIDAAIKQAEELKVQAEGDTEAVEYLEKEIEYLHAKAGEKTRLGVDIYSEEGIQNLNKDLDVLNSKLDEDHKLKIDWDKLTPENIQSQIDSATAAVEKFVNEDGTLDINTEGAQEALNVLQALQQKAWDMNSESNIMLRVDESQLDSATSKVVNDFAEIQAAAYNLESIKATPGVNESQIEKAKIKLQELINEFTASEGGMTATMDLKNLGVIDLASGKIDELSQKLTTLNATSALQGLGVAESAILGAQIPDKQVNVNAKLNKTEVDTWNPAAKTQDVNAKLHKGDIDTWIPASRTQIVYIERVEKGGHQLNGNAHANGNASLWQRGVAFAKGTWGAVKDSVALTGELGR